jgi:hypothetical protein
LGFPSSVAAGKLRTVVAKLLPLVDVREAHEFLANRAVFGKVVLVPGGEAP